MLLLRLLLQLLLLLLLWLLLESPFSSTQVLLLCALTQISLGRSAVSGQMA